jgi:putative PIN family toxin of toxin-antitoxin system
MPDEERLVLDTNVVVSGILFPGSAPSQVLLKARTCQVLASDATLIELVEVLGRARFDRYVQRSVRQGLAAQFTNACEMVQVSASLHICRDPKDDKFLELAVDGRAHIIVTGERDLLELHPFHGIAILTPATYLELK